MSITNETNETQSSKPNTSLGANHASLYRSNFNTNEASIPNLKVDSMELIANIDSSSSYTLSSNNDTFIWRVVVDGTNGALSFDRNYSRDIDTEIVTSIPQYSMVYDTGTLATYTQLNGIIVKYGAINIESLDNDITFTGEQIRNGIIVRNSVSGQHSDRLPSSSDIFNTTLLKNIQIGAYFDFSILNAITGDFITLFNSLDNTTTFHSTTQTTIDSDDGNDDDQPVRQYRVVLTSLIPNESIVYEI